ENLRTGFKPDPEALLLQAQLFEAKKAPDKSVESTQRALDAVGNDEAAQRRVALSHVRALLRAGREKDATDAAEELLRKYPEFLPAKLVLAGLYINGNRADTALELVTPL